MAQYKQISATTQIKADAGKVFGVLVSSTSSGTIALYDTPDGDTNDPKILNTFTPSAGQTVSFLPGAWFSKGLYAVIANTLQVTVIYE
jgi:hypothetical protein